MAGFTTHATQTFERETVRCAFCTLVQFRTQNNRCRRCTAPLADIAANASPFDVLAAEPPVSGNGNGKKSSRKNGLPDIGSAIRAWRQAKRLTQTDIRNRAGISRSYLSRIESGRMIPSLATMEKLATALELTIAELLQPVKRETTEDVLQDDFIQQLRPLLKRLEDFQRAYLVRKLQQLAGAPRLRSLA